MKSQLEQYQTMSELFPPSASCHFDVRQSCQRTGWWTVEEAQRAMKNGLSLRMMLDVSPDLSYGVLSPAYRGCEGNVALNSLKKNGCAFDADGSCRLHNTGLQPLECRFCHHTRVDLELKCHEALDWDWRTPQGQALVQAWTKEVGLWIRYKFTRSEQPATNLHTR